MAALWWYVMLKIIRISKANRITSIADFIASRYGKSQIAGRARHHHRGDRDHSLHRAAAEGDLQHLLHRAAVPRSGDAGQADRAALPRRQHLLHRDAARGLHDPVRHPPPRRDRAPRRAGGGDRLRVGGEAARLHRGGRLRHVLDVRRLRRHLRAARAQVAQLDALLTTLGVRRRQLRDVGLAHLPVDGRDHVPAAPVPGDGRGERGRAPPHQGDLALPALPPRDQHLRAADRARRAAALSRRHGRRGYLRADAADRRRTSPGSRSSRSSAGCRPPPAW